MAIYRVLSATVNCDRCDALVAHLEFDANIERLLEDHTKTWCPSCYKIYEADEKARKAIELTDKEK